jgi:hypothetical protein
MPHATKNMQRNVDRLVRSLVGVVDYGLVWADSDTIERLDILKDSAVEEYQLVRNVVSGLGAGCGVRLQRTSVRVFVDATAFAAVRDAAAVASGRADDTQEPSVPKNTALLHDATGAPVSAQRNGHNGESHSAVPAPRIIRTSRGPVERAEEPDVLRLPVPPRPVAESVVSAVTEPAPRALTINRIELEPRGATLRCRVVLGLGDRIYSAIAEVPSSPTAEAEITARVTLDALHAGALACARLEGVGFSTIADTTFVLASVRDMGGLAPRAGAVALQDSMAYAACSAVLAAVGPITTDNLVVAEQRLGSMLS